MIERQQFVRLRRPNDDSSGLRDSTEAFLVPVGRAESLVLLRY